MKIDTDDKDIIVSFFEDLVKFIKEEIDNTLEEPTISARLCVINFTFNDISIDLNIVGYTPYLHSVLFRIYNLLDARFSMLVLCIKYIIKEIGLKTISGETSFLNSFSWEMLIKAFLQDIIKPPILPKLIENSDQNKISVKFGKLFFNTEGGKNLKNFINDMYTEKISVPDYSFRICLSQHRLCCSFVGFLFPDQAEIERTATVLSVRKNYTTMFQFFGKIFKFGMVRNHIYFLKKAFSATDEFFDN